MNCKKFRRLEQGVVFSEDQKPLFFQNFDMEDHIVECLDEVVFGVSDLQQIIIDYLDEAGHASPFDIPVGSIIRLSNSELDSIQYSAKGTIKSFQIPSPTSSDWEPAESIQITDDRPGRFWECVGICPVNGGEECQCKRPAGSNWFLVREINSQCGTSYYIMQDVDIIQKGESELHIEGSLIAQFDVPLYLVGYP